MLMRCNGSLTDAGCGRVYDDAEQWTICPHNPLDVSADPEAFCWACDLRTPCACPDGIPTSRYSD